MPDLKMIFTVNLPLKFFMCYRCKCWHWNCKVSPYIIWYTFGPNAGEIWTNMYAPKCTKILSLFDKNPDFLKPFSTNRRRHFTRRFYISSNCLMANYWLSDYHLSVFKKLWNQVKSCTKHGRPNLYETPSQ